MIDAFENRLADVLADALEDIEEIHVVARPRDGLPSLRQHAAKVLVRILDAAPSPAVGDDRRDVTGSKGAWELRTVLHLSGTLLVQVEVARARAAVRMHAQRGVVMGALDAVLVAMQDEQMRSGRALATAEDQGFDIHGMRLVGVQSEADSSTDHRRIAATFSFEGHFWPVEPAVEGDAITDIPTRMAFLPVQLPQELHVEAGGADLHIPVKLDLRAISGATPVLVARLMGSEPPGELLGATADLPEGSVGYEADSDGVFGVVYRPPAALSGAVSVRVSLRLSHAGRASVSLAELTVDVVGT